MTTHSTAKRSMVALGGYTSRSDAELPQMLLWAAGIPYEIEAGDAGAADRYDLTVGVRLLVDEPDARDARFVLAAA